jgi:hypothetical protein
MPGMPVLMEGIIGTNALPVNRAHQQEESLIILDQLYARDYTIYRDIHIISKGYKWLGT